ncbi:MAG: GNAT family N-acetyltransferase [Streptococcaceae bacterium]|jgi:ribosomal protein S18 acetylase RimI-like enzyme|nr:GNAT family N-acetyltransferase [Streptococcaceae bacterium]
MQTYIEDFSMQYYEEVLSLWNETLIHDKISTERFLTQIIFDENFGASLFLVALNASHTVIGFAYGIKRKQPYLTRGLEPKRAWINMIAVAGEKQRRGIGSALLKALELRLKQLGTEEITLCAYSPNYFTPGIDVRYESGRQFFEKHGYQQGEAAVSMDKNLSGHVYPLEKSLEELKLEGIRIIPWKEKYSLKLIDFAESEFGGGWHRNINHAVQSGSAKDLIFIAVDKNDEVIGFCMRKIDGNDCRFGPIGVSSALRTLGIGGKLLEVMLDDLQKRNILYTFFLWTSGKTIDFYKKHGFKIFRDYYLYRKEIV